MKVNASSSYAALLLAVACSTSVVWASYPADLQWSVSCPSGIDYCATMEFCQSGNAFGYRMSGETGCTYPGPLIRLKAGSKYLMTLENTASSSTETNLHTHGLHIVGQGDSDDVVRHVSGGNCLEYTWDLDAQHPGGTYWYHSHIHGTSNAQVSGGAFGMIIVEDNDYEFVNGQRPSWTYNDLPLQISKLGNTVTANGNSDEIIDIEANKWYRLRVSVVDPRGVGGDVVFTEQTTNGFCTMHKVANDGVWASEVPLPTQDSSKRSFYLSGSSRADFAIRCTGVGDSVDVKLGRQTQATIIVRSLAASPDAEVLPGFTPTRPDALQGLDSGFDFSRSISMSGAQIDGSSWDPLNALDVIEWSATHEWTISGSGAHPFHLHLYRK
jgi:FtsP/CotA-like multicopper oxidase with cupredoxin domain